MNDPETPFALSVVVPVYNGAATVPLLVAALARLEVPGGLEIVLVVDGSPDNSLEVCRELCRRDTVALTVVDLARNFGEHNAVMAGFAHARGAYIVNMDDDLQNSAEDVVPLWRHARDNGYDVVYAQYPEKQHEAWRNLGSRLSNWCADRILDKPKGLYLSSFRCVSSFLARELTRNTGPFPYLDGLILQTTQRVGRLQVDHLPRAEGQSNYTLQRLLRLFFSMLLNFSIVPLRIASLIGFLSAALGAIGLIWVVVESLFALRNPQGWASSVFVSMLMNGLQLLVLGIIGEYLGRMFLTVNQRPQFVVRDVERNSKAAGGAETGVRR